MVRKRDLREYPDIFWALDSGIIQELIERLCVVRVKPHCVYLPV